MVVSTATTSLKRERGFTILELIIVLAGAFALIGIGYYLYKTRVEPGIQSQTAYQKIVSILGGIEQAKSSRGGVYPAYNGPVNTPGNPILPYLGDANSPDLAGVTYQCNAGTNQTLTIVVPTSIDTQRGRNQLQAKLNSAFGGGGATATVEAGSTTIQIPNVICQ